MGKIWENDEFIGVFEFCVNFQSKRKFVRRRSEKYTHFFVYFVFVLVDTLTYFWEIEKRCFKMWIFFFSKQIWISYFFSSHRVFLLMYKLVQRHTFSKYRPLFSHKNAVGSPFFRCVSIATCDFYNTSRIRADDFLQTIWRNNFLFFFFRKLAAFHCSLFRLL